MSSLPALPDGWRLDHVATIDGTNAELLRRADVGEAAGLAIRADVQTAGRGRRGRNWDSPTGNLYLSVLVDAQPVTAGQVGFAAALALFDAIQIEAGGDVPNLNCKWPNDLLFEGAKVAGLLLEAVPNRDQVVVGMGANLIPVEVSDAVYPVGALTEFPIDPKVLSARVCERLGRWLETWNTVGFTALRRVWLERAIGLGDTMIVRLPHEQLDGTFDGLADDGALLLNQGAAGIRTVSAGDVFFGPGD
ncbi:MAG: biotin--[acetyl-CoA-carboxylase] ligase [Alphaproteobacteria bacterium]|nr:biotin--[acetyl-CoA-carboxylase] ligase [Alphaproteobacteria bacterium]